MIFKPVRTEIIFHDLNGTSLQNVKDNLRITDDEEDSLLSEYIIAATDRLEGWLGLDFLLAAKVNFYENCGNCATGFLIKARPFISISKIEYFLNGVYVELDPTEYWVQKSELNTIVCLKNTLTTDSEVPDPIKISYFSGYTKLLEPATFQISGTTITVTEVLPHGLPDKSEILVTGLDQESYNGVFEITVVDVLNFTYKVKGPPAGNPTGTGIILANNVPVIIQIGIKQMVARMYANRGDCCDDCGDVPCITQSLLKGLKTVIIRTVGPIYGCCC